MQSKKLIKQRFKEEVTRSNIAVSLLILLVLVAIILNYAYLKSLLDSGLEKYGLLAILFLTFILDIMPISISPTFILATGILLGMSPLYVITATVIGSSIGSVLGFYLGERHMRKIFCVLISKENMDFYQQKINKYGKVIVFLTAISPLPFIPILIGALSFSRKNFLIYGLIPRAIGLIVVGILLSFFNLPTTFFKP